MRTRNQRPAPPPPAELARLFRTRFAGMIPESKTAPLRGLTAFDFARLIQEQAGCSFREAAAAVAAVVPELFA